MLKVNETYEPARMGKMLSFVAATGSTTQAIWANPHIYTSFSSFLEQLKSLENLKNTCTELLETEKIGRVPPDEILELELIDYNETGIPPERITSFFRLITSLHTNMARIHGLPGDTLKIVFLDSGSDVIVGLQCAKLVIESIRTLLGEWWSKIKFRSFDSFDKKMDAVSKGLTVLKTIQESVSNHVIDEETGNNLKQRVLSEVNELIGIGATLPLRNAEEVITPRQLLIEMRNTKLLGPGQPKALGDAPDGSKT
jgi:hypothetical protein